MNTCGAFGVICWVGCMVFAIVSPERIDISAFLGGMATAFFIGAFLERR